MTDCSKKAKGSSSGSDAEKKQVSVVVSQGDQKIEISPWGTLAVKIGPIERSSERVENGEENGGDGDKFEAKRSDSTDLRFYMIYGTGNVLHSSFSCQYMKNKSSGTYGEVNLDEALKKKNNAIWCKGPVCRARRAEWGY